ncbi:hypothetical protein F2Q70_00020477 [Brassica cretica]|uniref:Uncharacterized protein n=1 Tax=Brassica cretica TaxID=69181 RepID=A0A8S9GQM1_BRACR|nr:hypothetical protein F2Q70_00020477 [Brassica cretica]
MLHTLIFKAPTVRISVPRCLCCIFCVAWAVKSACCTSLRLTVCWSRFSSSGAPGRSQEPPSMPAWSHFGEFSTELPPAIPLFPLSCSDAARSALFRVIKLLLYLILFPIAFKCDNQVSKRSRFILILTYTYFGLVPCSLPSTDPPRWFVGMKRVAASSPPTSASSAFLCLLRRLLVLELPRLVMVRDEMTSLRNSLGTSHLFQVATAMASFGGGVLYRLLGCLFSRRIKPPSMLHTLIFKVPTVRVSVPRGLCCILYVAWAVKRACCTSLRLTVCWSRSSSSEAPGRSQAPPSMPAWSHFGEFSTELPPAIPLFPLSCSDAVRSALFRVIKLLLYLILLPIAFK